MNNIKVITLFHANKNVPFMTCMVKDIEEDKHGIKLILENGNNIYVKGYDSFFLSESANDCDKERMVNVYGRLISELSQVSEKTIRSLMSETKAYNSQYPNTPVSVLDDYYYCCRIKANAPDESALMNALGLQDLREAIAEDNFLSEVEALGGIVLHSDMGYPVLEYKGTDIKIAIEPINLAHMRDLTNGYVVMFRDGEYEQEMKGDLHEALSLAVDRLNIAVVFYKNK
ncbi:hypothetical protein [Pectobacterium parmentieri]|uniref:Uncharacterized protein n=1 Tax=Pectobacterium parmentieri TaxID=1905730 RepID=A0A8B3F4Q0_PECPM|nr:hypothetical protein [Pectobacterium parmentieri]AOR59255.1 hypothetical protein A8F97_10060 [Pectobacterium parmentieri]AYH09730.1 hypothetical protein C5E24_08575 [Pectobacterium parmentieri]AYH19561.1 hypothetical protein C5E22_14225 [Pectobacterium parmentieri]AYH36050.1 hypothetical protein C5E17_08525 [Pectobacterium parmentieri]AZS56154.1 hypothetical protein C5E18_08520 [Pectobacterium parmentieri]